MRIATRAGLIRVSILLAVMGVLSIIGYRVMIRMPGTSFPGELPPLSPRELAYQEQLSKDLHILAGDIGERNVFIIGSLDKARAFLEPELKKAGFAPSLQEFEALGEQVANIEVEIKGDLKPEEIVVIGAHYDSVAGSPGANDNGTGFVGNTGSRQLVRRCIKRFRDQAHLPSEGVATLGSLPGIGWSDHWSFWQHGYLGVMVTDTAPFRYTHYHQETDQPDKIDYPRFARVVAGLEDVVEDLVNL